MSGSGWYVCYTVLGQKMAAGPYTSYEAAEKQREDIKGFEGVSGAWSTESPPAEYKKLSETKS